MGEGRGWQRSAGILEMMHTFSKAASMQTLSDYLHEIRAAGCMPPFEKGDSTPVIKTFHRSPRVWLGGWAWSLAGSLAWPWVDLQPKGTLPRMWGLEVRLMLTMARPGSRGFWDMCQSFRSWAVWWRRALVLHSFIPYAYAYIYIWILHMHSCCFMWFTFKIKYFFFWK